MSNQIFIKRVTKLTSLEGVNFNSGIADKAIKELESPTDKDIKHFEVDKKSIHYYTDQGYLYISGFIKKLNLPMPIFSRS